MSYLQKSAKMANIYWWNLLCY